MIRKLSFRPKERYFEVCCFRRSRNRKAHSLPLSPRYVSHGDYGDRQISRCDMARRSGGTALPPPEFWELPRWTTADDQFLNSVRHWWQNAGRIAGSLYLQLTYPVSWSIWLLLTVLLLELYTSHGTVHPGYYSVIIPFSMAVVTAAVRSSTPSLL